MSSLTHKLNAWWERLPERTIHLAVALIAIVGAIAWSAVGGKDLNWDQLNYHFYLPYSLFGDRVSVDFIPTNGQSYLNPLAYVPFYWMVMQDWHSLLIASVLAAIHAANVFLAYRITAAALPDNSPNSRLISILGATLAFLSPVYLMEIGTTFADITTASLVLGTVLCGLHSHKPSAIWRDASLIGGVLIGIASALKLSNLVFGPACALLFVLRQETHPRRVRVLILYGLGSVIGLLIAQGYWGWVLWKEFGNPFLPYFGKYFPTDVFPKEGAALERFLPVTVLDSLLLPFRMVQLRAWIYIENVAPDLRFAALTLVGLLGSGYLALRHWRNKVLVEGIPLRTFWSLTAFFVTAYALWQWTSGNGRYGLVISLLCGPMVALAARYTTSAKRTPGVILVSLIALQIIHLRNGDLLWARGPWTPTWYEVSVPERLRHEPYLYVIVGGNSNSYVYPFLSSNSTFTNPIGQISFDFDKNGGQRLRQILDRHSGRLRVMAIAPSAELTDDTLNIWVPKIDSVVARLGFGVDNTDCEMITSSGNTTIAGRDFTPKDLRLRRLITCKLLERPFNLANERARFTRTAEQVSKWCPKLFKPSYTVLERSVNGWTATYSSTDSMLVFDEENILGVFSRSSANIFLGTVTQWEQGVRPSCDEIADKPRDAYTFD